MKIREIRSQDRVVGSLQRAFAAGKLHHAYLFTGPEGVGKEATARAWAKMLLCRDRQVSEGADGPFADSCGACASCRLFEADDHPDLHIVYKELRPFTEDDKGKDAAKDMPISVIREFLIDKVASRPVMGERTVYVLLEAEKLNRNSQNALLKVLEEPPGHCQLMLLCSRLDAMLPTILSRCQVLGFGPVDTAFVAEKLREAGVGEAEAGFWARYGEGSVGEAMQWAQLRSGQRSAYEVKRELVSRVAGHTLADSLELAEWLLGEAKELAAAWSSGDTKLNKTDVQRRVEKGLIRMMQTVYLDGMHLAAGTQAAMVHADQDGEVGRLAAAWGAESLAERVAKCEENMRWIDANVNDKLVFEELLLSCAECDRM